jgi:multiple sugar transport system substrate-binding protein
MKKRLLALTLAAVVAATTALVGCSKTKTTETTETPKATEASKPSEPPKAGNEVVTIEYWQYFFETKTKLMDNLIADFQQKNPNIKITHQHFPYDAYEQKLAAAIAAGTGPDILNLYYGWVPKYVKSKTIQELPKDKFPVDKIEKEFPPMIKASKIDGKYYSLPTGVRTLGLFWNKDIFKANGFDPEKPPKTIDEMVDMAKKMTKRNGDKLEIEGLTFQPTGQLHSWFRPVLLEQYGQKPLSDDYKKVLWNASENGYKAFEFMVNLSKKEKVGEPNFMTDDATAFINGKAALHIDGSYRLAAIKSQAPNLNYGITELPELNGKKSSFGSYWTNAINSNTKGKKLDASVKFLEYLTSTEVMKKWTTEIGEIGARTDLANDPELLKDAKLAPFIKQLPVATSYFYIDEAADRIAIVDAVDQVLLNNMEPRKALDEAVQKVQKLLDDYWK